MSFHFAGIDISCAIAGIAGLKNGSLCIALPCGCPYSNKLTEWVGGGGAHPKEDVGKGRLGLVFVLEAVADKSQHLEGEARKVCFQVHAVGTVC